MGFDPIVLKKIRKTHPNKPTQDDLAAVLGINRATYGKKENGIIPVSLKDLENLADFYRIEVKQFFDQRLKDLELPKKGRYKSKEERVEVKDFNTHPLLKTRQSKDAGSSEVRETPPPIYLEGEEKEIKRPCRNPNQLEDLKNLALSQSMALMDNRNEILALKQYIAELEAKLEACAKCAESGRCEQCPMNVH